MDPEKPSVEATEEPPKVQQTEATEESLKGTDRLIVSTIGTNGAMMEPESGQVPLFSMPKQARASPEEIRQSKASESLLASQKTQGKTETRITISIILKQMSGHTDSFEF